MKIVFELLFAVGIEKCKTELILQLDNHTGRATAANVAEMYQVDLDIKYEYNGRGLNYWCVEERKTVFIFV